MYLVIRCPGCRTFTYVDRYQRHKLCHVCGETITVARATVYLEVRDYTEAESVVGQLERYLHQKGKEDLTPAEVSRIRAQYAQWLLNQA
jgi:Domain of unknown function (DUF1922)